ncbi:hypothetical protein M2341_000994 [Sphingobium sp. B7D2B]|uniref:hypothetical protein n=1 Tax=Sphingobium sp. B7D2B TaxID=2940583 RepID=UPI00222402CB|nr:hypothetical protein [Sphingobium sp. B7D2B]MCW2365547.1 hypothetical protein [Sphingobium sp. B7D2B]
MSAVAVLKADLELNSADFISGMRKAAVESEKTSKTMRAAMGGAQTAVAGLAAAVSIDFLAGLTKSALDYSDAIADLSDRTGASTKFIQEFRYNAQMLGSDFGTADAAVEKFAKTVGDAEAGNKAAAEKLKEYGITARNVDEAVLQAADSISKMDSPTKQLSATMDLFGKKAGTLQQTMAAGSEGFKLQARAARDLGIILEDHVVRSAGDANDKLDTMKMILNAQMANAIAQNATALVSLGTGVMSVVGSLVQFWNQNPKAAMTILGGIAGFALGKHPAAAALGAAGGFLAGRSMEQMKNDGNMDIGFRQQQMRDARAKFHAAQADKGTNIGIGVIRLDKKGAFEEYQKQVGLLQTALNAAKTKPTVNGDIPDLPAGPAKASSGPSAAELAEMERQRAFAAESDLMRAEAELKRAQYIDHGNYLDEYARQRDEVDDAFLDAKRSILNDVKNELNTSGKYTAEEAEKLILIQESLQTARKNQINHEENARIEEEIRNAKQAELDDQMALLDISSGMARTARERRAIELRRLEMEKKRERAELEYMLAPHSNASPEAKASAQSRLSGLDARYNSRAELAVRNTAGPLESMLQSIPDSADQVNEALESIAANGLATLSNGIVDALMEWENFGDAFIDVGKQVTRAILDMVIQMTLLRPLGNMIGGALGVSPLPGHANGGLVSTPGWKTVGERGEERVYLPGGSKVIPHSQLAGLGNGGGGLTISVDARGATDPALVKSMVELGIAQAMPHINASGFAYTMARAGRTTI